MPPSRSIPDFFQRPAFARKTSDRAAESPAKHAPPAPDSSPLTELSSSFWDSNVSPGPSAGDDSASQLKRSLSRAAENGSNGEHEREQLGPLDLEDEGANAGAGASASASASFDHSQRIVKNGREVVISSDGEDTDSVGSLDLEAPDAMFTKFAKPSAVTSPGPKDDDVFAPRATRSSDSKTGRFGKSKKTSKVYRNTIDTLVTQAVDDNETEAGIAKLKATLERDRALREADANGFDQASGLDEVSGLDEGVLTSALVDEQDGEMEMRRLLDAVRRTEAFDLEMIWTFFDYGRGVAPMLDFPRKSVSKKTYESALTGELIFLHFYWALLNYRRT